MTTHSDTLRLAHAYDEAIKSLREAEDKASPTLWPGRCGDLADAIEAYVTGHYQSPLAAEVGEAVAFRWRCDPGYPWAYKTRFTKRDLYEVEDLRKKGFEAEWLSTANSAEGKVVDRFIVGDWSEARDAFKLLDTDLEPDWHIIGYFPLAQDAERIAKILNSKDT